RVPPRNESPIRSGAPGHRDRAGPSACRCDRYRPPGGRLGPRLPASATCAILRPNRSELWMCRRRPPVSTARPVTFRPRGKRPRARRSRVEGLCSLTMTAVDAAASRSTTLPDALVSVDWAREHLDDSSVRFIEVDVDTASYDTG